MLRPQGFIVPCQPSTAVKPPTGPDWLHEIKHDGYRIMAWRAADRVRLLTRNRSDFGERFPLVTEAIGGLPARSCVIDGEITVCDAQGLSVFELLRHGPRVKRNAVLFAFDLLEHHRCSWWSTCRWKAPSCTSRCVRSVPRASCRSGRARAIGLARGNARTGSRSRTRRRLR
jgi:hypothetical protein